ncbi:uncharacterized protein [Drosophila takahashii]|uniref:uncharacterized protein isoform X1 n=1 Tax=Drosophila takahashii TaxID=29030 RepID=UPI003898E401
MLIKENFNDGEEKDESKDETAVDRAQTSALINENVSDEEKYGSKDETAVVRAQTPALDSKDNRSAPFPDDIMDQVPNAFDDKNNVQNPLDSLIGDLTTIEDEQDQNDGPTVISI